MKSMRAGPGAPGAVPGKWRSRVCTPEKRVTLKRGERERERREGDECV